MAQWTPKRTYAEVDAILASKGTPFELEHRLVDGRVQRVYKNLPPSLREFWIMAAKQHANEAYLVYENQRYTFRDAWERSVKAASVLMKVYGVRKGDRVAICSRNYPEHLVAFWACHLIGAISVQVNAWSPKDVLAYCFTHTGSKVIILDVQRADLLEPVAAKLSADTGATGILVLESHEGKGHWQGMKCWNSVLRDVAGDYAEVLSYKPSILPDDDATILFTSGTTGVPKGVLSTHRMYLTGALNIMLLTLRAMLRRGESLPTEKPAAPPRGLLISVPLFHVTGAGQATLATLLGTKIAFIRKWIPKEAARLIKEENIGIAGGVPSMAIDLTEVGTDLPLDSLTFGGAPAPDVLHARTKKAFPGAYLTTGYGLTETSSLVVGLAGEDFTARPLSCGRPALVNDVKVMSNDREVATGELGEIWLRGPNILKGYWRDTAATNKVITQDGWFKTGDLGYVDQEGFVYIKDRIKDIIIRGGENIDSTTVENALYAEEGVLEAAAIGVPHYKLGELVAAVVSLKPGYSQKVTEASLIKTAQKTLPKHAVPVMVLIQSDLLERTPSGKIVKGTLRKLAKEVWAKRPETPKL